MKETKFAREGIMLDKYVLSMNWAPWLLSISCAYNAIDLPFRFHKMLGADEMRAWYGPDHVSLAAERGAIGTLLISDELFR